ncbi:MAG: hypothetical protein EPO26_14980 [Chloroflexota bacterium]|nr:MAG: hypothetical protein EPO26_14980 [Chloroflexota bacterium]
MNVGDTFINLNEQSHFHLWFVVTQPGADGNVVILNLTSQKEFSDTTCQMVVGDHPFVTRASVIYYHGARLVPANSLDEWLRRGVLEARPAARPALVARIRAGVFASERVHPTIIEAVRRCPWTHSP